MRSRLAALVSLLALVGCAAEPRVPCEPVTVAYDNPVVIPIANYEAVWDGVVDVVSDYFRIERVEPVRLIEHTLTEGRIDTYPLPGATLLEPWYHDSANDYERLESTLQSIRRYAVVKVIPAQNGGFWVDAAVFKELENMRQPEHATAGAAIFRNDSSASLPSRINNDTPTGVSQNWIPQGRDTAAEQRILGQILNRFTPAGTPTPVN